MLETMCKIRPYSDSRCCGEKCSPFILSVFRLGGEILDQTINSFDNLIHISIVLILNYFGSRIKEKKWNQGEEFRGGVIYLISHRREQSFQL